MKNPLNYFRQPAIHATLIKGGRQSKVNVINANSDQAIVILYMTIKQVAKMVGVPYRSLINHIIRLDVNMMHREKQLAKAVKRQQYTKKK